MDSNETSTIFIGELDQKAQEEIEEDTNEQYNWYAEPNSDGTYTLHPVEENLMELFEAQGGPKPGWKRVLYQ